MKTEASKTFHHGFNLREAELRRIVDTVLEKIGHKLSAGAQPFLSFEVKYKNGTTTYFDSIDPVLSQENAGHRQIVRLSVWAADAEYDIDSLFSAKPDPSNRIRIRFTNSDEEEDPPVRFFIAGDDRDWVLVTASELEERIAKVKCAAPSLWLRPPRVLAAPLLSVIFLFLIVAGITVGERKTTPHFNTIEERWKAGTLRDPVEAIAILENEYNQKRPTVGTVAKWALLYPLGAVCAIALIVVLAAYLHPAYSFAWGDYTRVLDARSRIRQFVYVGVLVALVIGTIASVLANKLSH